MFINIRLKSPIQSWGNQTNTHTAGEYRGTNEFPSYSGVFGLICACSGLNQERNPTEYAKLFESVRYVSAVATRTFNILVDNQNMGGGYNKHIQSERMMVPVKYDGGDWVGMWRDEGNSNAKLSKREYLEDADFIVTIEVPDDISERVIQNLKNPVWIPVFGRSSCIPSTRLFLSSHESYDECISSAKKTLGVEKVIAYMSDKPRGKFNLIHMYDVPVVSQRFKYTRRTVYKTIV